MFKRRGQQLPGENFYVKVPHHWLRDWRLTGNAKAIMAYWLGHDEDYEVTLVQTLAEFNEGERAMYAAINLLVKLGYVERYQAHQGGGRGKGFGQIRYDLGPAAFEQQYVRNWGTSDPSDDRPRRDGTKAPAKAIGDVSAGPRATTFRGSTKRGPAKGGSKKNNPLEEQPLEDQNPTPSSSSVTDGERSPSVPEEEGPDLNHDNRLRAELVEAARKVLETVQQRAGLRAARRLAPLQVTELAGLLAPALAAGWTADDAADALGGELDTADNLFGVLRRRVRDLTRKPAPDPATARPRAGRPPSVPVVACTTCDPLNPGWLDVDGPARKCPTCVPGKPGRMHATPA
jgi:hypothetical protein